ncbi:MAG: hypothetical protein QOK32_1671 [Gaiellaceae bacterium]|nr:hypothetical protein [Gaiellaceae bacterium]MDX6518754.1 hypothetical protein [Gaiellaceae bacterium]MDX6544068.1 hypothetical protein [Gaiellaceae bacterium]
MEGHAVISSEILASYAGDAAREVPGVHGLVESTLHRHRGVRVTSEEGRVSIELHLEADWGASIPELGRGVQRRVREYLARMTDVDLVAVDVTIDEIAP